MEQSGSNMIIWIKWDTGTVVGSLSTSLRKTVVLHAISKMFAQLGIQITSSHGDMSTQTLLIMRLFDQLSSFPFSLFIGGWGRGRSLAEGWGRQYKGRGGRLRPIPACRVLPGQTQILSLHL